MGKLIVELPDETHREFKKKAAINHKTLKDIVTGLIDDYLSSSGKQQPAKKNTGLCGRWDDDKTADEIIKNIKTHRKWFSKSKN